MNYIKRDVEPLIKEISKEYSCILVAGPRQVGKTTLLKNLDPQRTVVSLDDFTERKLAQTDPATFLKIHPQPVLIDEVQYAPELFSCIKIKIDNGAKPGSFWITGSQVYKLMSLAQESLAGRTAIINLTSLSQQEIYNPHEPTKIPELTFDINSLIQKKFKKCDINEIFQRIFNGSMPGFASGKFTNRDIFYSSYLQTYIARDIAEDEESKNIDKIKFIDFIRAASCRTAQILNIHSIAQDVEISDDTAKRWLHYLEKSGIIFYLHPYENNLLKRTIKTPKLYFFDTGLVAYLTRYSNAEILQNGAINGAIFENYAVCELRKNFLNKGLEPPLYYYHDKDGNEIDVIVEENGCLHPIEIKKSSTPVISMAKGFNALKKTLLPVSTGAIICSREEVSALDSSIILIPIGMV